MAKWLRVFAAFSVSQSLVPRAMLVVSQPLVTPFAEGIMSSFGLSRKSLAYEHAQT